MSFARISSSIFVTMLIVALAYPAAFVTSHGWGAAAWPSVVGTPLVWISVLTHVDLAKIVIAYSRMAVGVSDAFWDGGQFPFYVMCLSIALVWILAFITRPRPDHRIPNGAYGNARWANQREIDPLRTGVEIGLDPSSGEPIRFQPEGNLQTIAPPRFGKTAGVVLPNLLAPDSKSWLGPVVVIDPKAAAYAASKRRRTELNRTVRCIDPVNLAGGDDHWNMLAGVEIDDVLFMQAAALALLSDSADQSESAAYFRSRLVDLLVGAMIAAINIGRADLATVSDLLVDREAFLKGLESVNSAAASAAREILLLEERARDGIMSSAQQVTQFLRDERMRTSARRHTFELGDLCRGDTDLFIIIPADARRDVLAPFVRLLLAGLFAASREKLPAERILVIIDEAFSLGYFAEILKGVSELPGYRLSLWLIWQSRNQMVQAYGEDGAEVLLATAEVVTVFGLPAVQPEEVERWSRSLGSYTAEKSDWSPDPRSGKPVVHKVPEERRLVAPSDLPNLLMQYQIAFVNNKRLVHPIKMRRAVAYTEKRFSRYIDLEPYAGPV